MSARDDSIDPMDLRRALGCFVTGITIVTTRDENGAPRGFTANSFTSVSLDPPLVLACVGHGSSSYPAFARTERFAINILSDGQREVSGLFAAKGADKFGSVAWLAGRSGSPILEDTVAWIDCRVHQRVEAGDHLVLIGRVLDYAHSAKRPLGFCRGSYLDFELEQTAIGAKPRQPVRIGAILEHEGHLLLLRDSAGGLTPPLASRLGRHDTAEDSLNGLLGRYSVAAEIGFLFAVYDDPHTNTHYVYYRGQLTKAPAADDPVVSLVHLDEMPWQALPDEATRSMLGRYVTERREHRFGIYVGDTEAGTVRALDGTG